MSKQKSAKSLFDLLDRYLIEDLKTMIEEISERPKGGVGYPAIQTIISGMELLGMFASGGKEKKKAFDFFWENYLEKLFPKYNGKKEIFYKNIRHGTAHFYLVRTGIYLTKSGSNHLQIISSPKGDRFFNIDLKELFTDFKLCYEEIKEELENPEKIDKFCQGLKKLFDEVNREHNAIISLMKNLQNEPKQPYGQSRVAVTGLRSSISYGDFGENNGISGTVQNNIP